MNNIARRKNLLDLIRERGGLSIADLAARFKVSKMTVHRDLEVLEGRGVVKRIFGGAIPVADVSPGEPGETASLQSRPAVEECFICFRPVSRHFLYCVTLSGGDHKWACCPHCGMSTHLILQDAIVMAMTSDFLSGKLLPARHAFFLVGSVAAPCCRPSVISFEEAEMAHRFQAGFGGTVLSFQAALDAVAEAMSAPGGEAIASCPHCRPDAGSDTLSENMVL